MMYVRLCALFMTSKEGLCNGPVVGVDGVSYHLGAKGTRRGKPSTSAVRVLGVVSLAPLLTAHRLVRSSHIHAQPSASQLLHDKGLNIAPETADFKMKFAPSRQL
jgi:hypothetical protein